MSTPVLLNSSIGEYRLVDLLGVGGMGEVYRAVHAKIGRVVAVKVLMRASHGSGFFERFLNEARIQASLHHNNIATLYDFLELDGRPCIIMEYVDGQTLAERITSYGPLRLSEAVFIFQAVVEAIQYIHSRGIIHRDIKPNNIKISSSGRVKLLDFGIAKTPLAPGLTRTGDVVGTLQYLSPEQLRGGPLDARSDLWALGVLLYEMVTGRVPFEAATMGELYEKITKAAYVPPSALNPLLPREMEAVIARCLNKKPSDRYPSAQDLLQDTMRCAASVSTPRLSTIESETRATGKKTIISAAKKNWRMLSVAAALVLIIAFGCFVHTRPILISGPPLPECTLTLPREGRPVRIDVVEGRAGVYRNGGLVALTPYQFNARLGERIELVLKRDGFNDKLVNFEVNGSRNLYVYTMEKVKTEGP